MSPAAYYNELDPYAAQWLRNLIAVGHIAPGDVDERNISDVRPSDLAGYTQCHFFAGIGVWSCAMRCAGWPDDRPAWTGSCPCQPFSTAGAGGGFDDERHLWPDWFQLIIQCRPAIIFGEQVASKDAGQWLDLVQDDLEAMGYAFGAVPFPAASVGAPHIRDRLYWMADSSSQGLEERGSNGRVQCGALGTFTGQAIERGGDSRGLADPEQFDSGCQAPAADHQQQEADRSTNKHGGHCGSPVAWSSPTNGFWGAADWLLCRDGKWRPVEPGTFPLADGAPARVGRLRAYGNAICAPQAQAFIEIAMEYRP